jgi:glycosyltransferase involved in cell wall biosynthesis
MSALLAICIPTYNRSHHLVGLLDQLAGESSVRSGETRVLVADNCSPDDTPLVLERSRSRIPVLDVHRQESNLGGLANALWCYANPPEAEYVWVMGDDDRLEPGGLDEVVSLLRAHDPDWLHLPHHWKDESGRPIHSSPCPDQVQKIEGSRALLLEYTHWLTFVSASVHRRSRIVPVAADYRSGNAFLALLLGFEAHLAGSCVVGTRPIVHGGSDATWNDQRSTYMTRDFVRLYDDGVRLGLSAAEFARVLDGLYEDWYLDDWRAAPEEALLYAVSAFPHSRQLRHFATTLAAERGRPDYLAEVRRGVHVSADAAVATALVREGEGLYAAGDAGAALARLQVALRVDPGSAEAWNDIGVIMHAGHHPNAAGAFEQALALDPDYVEALSNRAILALESGDRVTAIALASRALELEPGHARAASVEAAAASAAA